MKQLKKVEVFTGIDTKKDETLIRGGHQRNIVNFDIDRTLGALVKSKGTDYAYYISGIEKIKGSHFFEFDIYDDDTDTNVEYRYLAIAAEKKINDVNTDVLIIADLNNTSIVNNIISSDDWLRNISGYALYDDFFDNTENTQLKESSKVDKYFFLSIDNELWINNRVQPPFRFYIDLEMEVEADRKKGEFSFITIPLFLSPPEGAEYNLIFEKYMIGIGGLEGGKYNFKYTYYDSKNEIESITHTDISTFNTLGVRSEILSLNEYDDVFVPMYHLYCHPDAHFFGNLKIAAKYKAIISSLDVPYLTLSYMIKIKLFYSTDNWKNSCDLYPEINYKTNDIGIFFYHVFELQVDTPAPIETGPIIPVEIPFAYICISKSEYTSNLYHKKKIVTLKNIDPIIILPTGNIGHNYNLYIGDCEILILSSEVNVKDDYDFFYIPSITNFNIINNKTSHPVFPLYGPDIERETEVFYSFQETYKNTYNASEYLSNVDDFKDYLMHFRETPEDRNPSTFYEKVLSNTFYSIETDPFQDMPLAGDIFEVLLTKLKVIIPFNNLISKSTNISSIKIYRNNLVSGISSGVYFLDKELDIEIESGFVDSNGNISQYWETDLSYISETNDLTDMLENDNLKDGRITLNKTHQLLLHKNRIAALDNSQLLIRYSELTPDIKDFLISSYYAFKASDGGRIVSIVPYQDNWIVLLNKNQFIIENVSRDDEGFIKIDDRTIGDNSNGCMAEGSVQVTPIGVIYASQDGFRRTDSYNVIAIDSIEKKYADYYKKIDWSQSNKIQSWISSEKYYCYAILKSENNNPAESILFVYHLSINEWTVLKGFEIDGILNGRLFDNEIYFADGNYIKKFSDINNGMLIDRGEFSAADYNMPVSDEFYAQDTEKNWKDNELNGCYLKMYNKTDNSLDAVYTINRNIFDVIYINEKVSGFDLYPNDPSKWGKLKGSSGKYYKIFRPIESYIETASYDFGMIEYSKSMAAIEIFFKAGMIHGILTISYSIDEGGYQFLCEAKAVSAAGFGTGNFSTTGIGGYFSDGQTDYYCRIGRIPFRKIQRFNVIKFKIEHKGIDNFEIRKIIYHYNVHPVRRNNY